MCIPKLTENSITAERLHRFQTNFAQRERPATIHRRLYIGSEVCYLYDCFVLVVLALLGDNESANFGGL